MKATDQNRTRYSETGTEWTGTGRTRRSWLDLRAPLAAFIATLAFGIGWAGFESWVAAARDPYPRSSRLEHATDTEDDSNGEARRQETSDAAQIIDLPLASIWLVDGFNVIHSGLLRENTAPRAEAEWWREPQRRHLLDRASRFCRPEAEIWVVFDGSDEGEQIAEPGRLWSVFAASADDWMLRRVRQAEDPSRLAVVTRDRQLADRARHRGAVPVDPARFLAACEVGA